MSLKPNALEMSDEDFMKADPSQFAGFTESASTATETADADDEHAPASEEEDAEEAAATPGQAAASDDDEQETEAAKGQDPEVKAADPQAEKAENKAAEDAADTAKDLEKKSGDAAELSDSQYAAIGKQIMGEFKANGATLKMKSAEDAIRLMQMGANYQIGRASCRERV